MLGVVSTGSMTAEIAFNSAGGLVETTKTRLIQFKHIRSLRQAQRPQRAFSSASMGLGH